MYGIRNSPSKNVVCAVSLLSFRSLSYLGTLLDNDSLRVVVSAWAVRCVTMNPAVAAVITSAVGGPLPFCAHVM